MVEEKFLKKPIITSIVGITALFSGFYFLKNRITGNMILEGDTTFRLLPLMGLLLIACSAILIIYSIKKR